MKKISCLLASLVFSNCYAQADKKTEQFEKVFDVISSEKVFSTPFAGVMQQLHGVCALSTATGVGADLKLTHRADPNLTQGGALRF